MSSGGRWFSLGSLYHFAVSSYPRVRLHRRDGPCLFFAWNGWKVREACVLLIIASHTPLVYKDVKRELRAGIRPDSTSPAAGRRR